MAFPETLETLIEEGVIDAVRSRLMSGKEASVFVVERQGVLLAAKVYKAREQRTFKATASYTEGRNQTRNSRDKRAMGKRTSYGRELIEESWRDVEVRALSEAFHAGVRVPQPFMLHDDVLLMELLVDDSGAPAPRLADFELPREVAEQLHREIFSQVRLLLSCGKIHGDLSAFNILMARGGPTLIDMPQVVDAARNNQAREILRRDLRNITEHLARFDARLLRFRDCGDALWQHYVNDTLDRATEPQEGGVGGGHHRSRRTRDAERGRMGRERPDPSAGRRDAPPHAGPPRPGAAGHGPPRERPHHPGGGGPPRERQAQGQQGPLRDHSPQQGGGGPRREGQSRDHSPPQGGGGPRREGQSQEMQGQSRDHALPQGGGRPPREGQPQGTQGQSRDHALPQGGGGPPREGQPPGTQGPPRNRPFDQGADGRRRDRSFQHGSGGPSRDRQPWSRDGGSQPERPHLQGAGGPRGEAPHSGAPGRRPPRDASLHQGSAGQGPPRDGPRHQGHGPPRERPPQREGSGPDEARAGGQRPGMERAGSSWQGPREVPRHPGAPRPDGAYQRPASPAGPGQEPLPAGGLAPAPPGPSRTEPPTAAGPRPAPAKDSPTDDRPRWQPPRDKPSDGD